MDIGCVYSVEDYASIDKPIANLGSIPFGISYIATSLKHAGHAPHILVFVPETNMQKIIGEFIEKYKPKLFCLTSVTSQFQLMIRIAAEIKNYSPDIYVILGGVHATLNPIETMNVEYFDAICIGEGEKAIVKLAEKIKNNEPISNINSLWIRDKEKGTIEKNDIDPFIQNLDDIPFIDRELWSDWIYDDTSNPTILIGRGCPNKCTYCSNHALANISNGRYVRYRSPANIVDEIRELIKKNPSISSIYLQNETLSSNLKYSYELCACLEALNSDLKMPISFQVNLSITKSICDNEEFVRRLRRANFDTIEIGLESGSEEIRNGILRRPVYSNNEIINFCKLLNKYHIENTLYVMIGLPGENTHDFDKTVDIVRNCNPKDVYLTILYPYPGTDLYKKVRDMGIMDEKTLMNSPERRVAVLNLPGFSKRQIRREFILFPYKVFKGKRPLTEIVYRTIAMIVIPYPKITPYLRQLRYVFKKAFHYSVW
jgi:radical SAM superfamily enzyme YgiQ (UPF0313 family)